MTNAELVQILPGSATPDGRWWFVLRELSEAEIFRARVQAQLDYLALTADVNLEDM